jgi:fatty-acyl-CoA synthase
MAALLLRQPALGDQPLPSLRGLLFTGAPLPAAIVQQVIRRLCPNIYEGYGLQETGFVTLSTPHDRSVRPDSVGRAVLFVDLRIVDAEGRDLPVGEIGEIIARSPNGTTAYLDNPEKSAAAFRNGWFHTGDLGRLDADGYLYICGRVKDMIVSGGQNVYSAEVEEALHSIPGVEDCAVFGLPDDTWGECVAAVFVTSRAITVEDVQATCGALLAGFKLPRKVFCQPDALPRTPTGKVQKFLLIERYSK